MVDKRGIVYGEIHQEIVLFSDGDEWVSFHSHSVRNVDYHGIG